MSIEIWKDIKGFEGLYQISNKGNVKSLNFHREGRVGILKGGKVTGNYKMYILRKDGKSIPVRAHRLVAQSFIPNPNNYHLVCHKDETLDENGLLYNGADNLYWGTYSDNTKDMIKKGRDNNHFKCNHPNKGLYGGISFASKGVIQYSKEFIFMKEWSSLIDVKRKLGISTSSISQSCSGKRKTAGGFIWRSKYLQ